MKTMKFLKNLLAILAIALSATVMSSCGGEEDEPKPVVEVAPWEGHWVFQSAVVVPNGGGTSYTVNSLSCSNTAPAFKVEYDVHPDNKATQISPCFNDLQLRYVPTIVNDLLTEITFYVDNDNDGVLDTNEMNASIYYDHLVIDINAKTIIGNQQTYGTAKTITTTFKLQ